jgi:hypothetical protein
MMEVGLRQLRPRVQTFRRSPCVRLLFSDRGVRHCGVCGQSAADFVCCRYARALGGTKQYEGAVGATEGRFSFRGLIE